MDLWKQAYRTEFGSDPDEDLAAQRADIDAWRLNWQAGYDAQEPWSVALVPSAGAVHADMAADEADDEDDDPDESEEDEAEADEDEAEDEALEDDEEEVDAVKAEADYETELAS